ncbi:MAG: amidohydrolase [Chitinophagaceae bacterium]|nr:amidohydrolase [Chitinophagaceae bacterium]MDP1764126.1 amidohydrolase [Sediminibacterium sp.]MDP1812472.1 amidohydrolase [Sediminibacterium sp.]MDP3129264.1 amidohydrolase [Sediminibacterium sp.]MDP3666943.1 amidohydrolase [Sediminibacterium sp.]
MKRLLSLCLLISAAASAQNLPANYEQLVQDETPKVVEWRRYFHQNPELSNREYNTSKKIQAHLKQLGIETKVMAGTGVVGILKGGKPGPVVALRADMDGLPVTERNDLSFKSRAVGEYNGQNVGVMHACGHDSHVAILMGTAEVLSKLKNEVPGTVVFLFQPAEEGAPGTEEGGAPLLIKEGALDNPKVEAVFGLHISSNLDLGKIYYKPEAFMASSDWFTIKVKGKQTHGAAPWQGVDPIVVSTQIIQGLQTIVSRQMDLTTAPVIITVGKITAGVRANIIPEEANMEGTIRTLDSKMQKEVHERIRITAKNIAEAAGATAEVNIDTKTLVTYNDPKLVAQTLPSLQKAAGENNVILYHWTTGAEDFSFYGTKAPSFFFDLGARDPKKTVGESFAHHTPDFYIDDSKLDVGVKAFCQLVFDYAKVKK